MVVSSLALLPKRRLPRKEPRRLNYVKCDFCRKRKQNCVPSGGSKCQRCLDKGLSCSEFTTLRGGRPKKPEIEIETVDQLSLVERSGVSNDAPSYPTYWCFLLSVLPDPEVYTPSAPIVQSLEKRTCLRCRQKNLKCAGGYPCNACLEAISAIKCSKTLRQHVDCIKTSFRDLNFLAGLIDNHRPYAAPFGNTHTVRFMIDAPMDTLSQRKHTNSILGSNINNAEVLKLLTGRPFVELAINITNTNFMHQYRIMLLSFAILHDNSHLKKRPNFLSMHVLYDAALEAGDEVLNQLDSLLNPRSLRSEEQCQLLFLVTLGILLGLQYNTPVRATSWNLTGASFGTQTSVLHAMKEQLCRMLSHYAILFASRFHLGLARNVEFQMCGTFLHSETINSCLWGSINESLATLPGLSKENMGRSVTIRAPLSYPKGDFVRDFDYEVDDWSIDLIVKRGAKVDNISWTT